MKTLATSIAIVAAAASAAIYHAGQSDAVQAPGIEPGMWIVSPATLATYERDEQLSLPENFEFTSGNTVRLSEAVN